jgi:hypothetical protein
MVLGTALGALLAVAVSGPVPATAADPRPPTLTVDRAWTVAKGAGLQVRLTLTCPDKGISRFYGLNVWTPTAESSTAAQSTQVRCGRRPTPVVVLLPAPGPDRFPAGVRTIHANAINCYWSAPEQTGCFEMQTRVQRTVTRARFVAETMTDEVAHLEFRNAVLTGEGDLTLTYRLTCDRPTGGVFSSTVVQPAVGGVTRSTFTGQEFLDCDPGPATRWTYTVPHPDGQPFTGAPTVVKTEWSLYEGCFWEGCSHGHDSRVVRPGR